MLIAIKLTSLSLSPLSHSFGFISYSSPFSPLPLSLPFSSPPPLVLSPSPFNQHFLGEILSNNILHGQNNDKLG